MRRHLSNSCRLPSLLLWAGMLTVSACDDDGSAIEDEPDTGVDAAPDGAHATSDAGNAPPIGSADAATGIGLDARVDAAAGETGGGDGGPGCTHPLQCQPGYPVVPFPAENSFDEKKAMLGKILFWEEQIGELDTMACGTCHRAEAGGSDPRSATPAAHRSGPDGKLDSQPGKESDDIRGSLGTPVCTSDGAIVDPTVQVTGRKAPTYIDAMFALEVFWDGRAGYCKNGEAGGGCFYDPDLPPGAPPRIIGQLDVTAKRLVGGALEAQASGPPVNPVEMACESQTWGDIASKLRTVRPLAKASNIPTEMQAFIDAHGASYPAMFADVYGASNKLQPERDPDDSINTRRIVYAIATHERRLTSHETPWDRWNKGDPYAMSERQVRGFELFMGKGRCGVCHAPPLFTDLAFHYLGFHKPVTDEGRRAITHAQSDYGRVKTPTVRNVGLREPGGLLRSGEGAGHDLQSMMGLYNEGGLRSDPSVLRFLDPSLEVLGLERDEIDAMIDFMANGLSDPRVGAALPPFDHPRLGSEP